MAEKNISVVCIKPGDIPVPAYIENDLLELSRLVNVDANGKPHPDFAPFEIVEIKDNINIVSSPKGEDRCLPVTRRVGRFTQLYGTIYIVKMDNRGNLVSLSRSETVDYCVKFFNKNITFEDLGLPPVNYGDSDDYDDDYCDEDDCKPSSKGHFSITCDDW